MPENLKVGVFVFGAILVLIALLGGNFKLFGAEVAATISNRFLRLTAFALGIAFLVIALHPLFPEEVAVISDSASSASPQPVPVPTSSPASQPSPAPTTATTPQLPQSPPVPVSVTSSSEPIENAPTSACILTISNPLVSLMSETNRLSRQISNVNPGEHSSLDHKVIDRGLGEEGWFQIEVEGRQGWIADDTWTIDSKSSSCP